MTGKLDIMTPGMALTPELKKGVYDKMPEDDTLFVAEHWMLKKMKKCIIMVAGSAAMKF